MEDINDFDSQSEFLVSGSRLKFKCKYCFRDMSSRQNLREHLYIHTGEKPYICTESGCGQKFRQGSLLSIHKKIHTEVKKSKKNSYYIERKITFPKLTELLKGISPCSLTTETLDQEKMKSEIGEDAYLFIRKFIS